MARGLGQTGKQSEMEGKQVGKDEKAFIGRKVRMARKIGNKQGVVTSQKGGGKSLEG